ncbi:MAG: cytochrome c [Gloeobacteraceae cyanobacterium ES-bin-144]|nr:cytochrome c [Verrucomicrobiales bacterium]
MSSPDLKPDLEDSINVTESHDRLVREAAACARENRISRDGNEPISLGILAVCGVVAIIAGGILGGAGNLFAYGSSFREGYTRTPAPGAAEQGPQPKEALAAYMAKGAKIYSAKCNGCHGSDAKGNGSTYPSLVGSKWVTEETERFAMIILNGLQGPVSNGTTYGVMPPQGIGMTSDELAGIMTYVRNNFGNKVGDVITVEMAKSAMEISAARKNAGNAVTGVELAADHAKTLPGAVLDSKTLVDPLTFAPVAAPKP